MKGKYLVTTDRFFVAPDGQQYTAVWGNVEILEDNILGVKTNRNSSNWYVKIGTDDNHVIVAGCQIHYACKSNHRPLEVRCTDWDFGSTGYQEKSTPSKIYFTDKGLN